MILEFVSAEEEPVSTHYEYGYPVIQIKKGLVSRVARAIEAAEEEKDRVRSVGRSGIFFLELVD